MNLSDLSKKEIKKVEPKVEPQNNNPSTGGGNNNPTPTQEPEQEWSDEHM